MHARITSLHSLRSFITSFVPFRLFSNLTQKMSVLTLARFLLANKKFKFETTPTAQPNCPTTEGPAFFILNLKTQEFFIGVFILCIFERKFCVLYFTHFQAQ